MSLLKRILRHKLAFPALVWAILIALLLYAAQSQAAGLIRDVYMTEKQIEKVLIRPGVLTVLSFPLKPDSAVMGPQSRFSIKYIENDIVLSGPGGSRTNMFVYLMGRRFGFEVVSSPGQFDEVVHVHDGRSMNAPAPKPKEKKHGK